MCQQPLRARGRFACVLAFLTQLASMRACLAWQFSPDEQYVRTMSLRYLGYFGLLSLAVFSSIAVSHRSPKPKTSRVLSAFALRAAAPPS